MKCSLCKKESVRKCISCGKPICDRHSRPVMARPKDPHICLTCHGEVWRDRLE